MAEKLTPRKLQAIETRANIQRAAMKLFEEHGYENVSVEDIAHAAGCSVGNIYHYFKGKEQLSLQVISSVDKEYSKLMVKYKKDSTHSAKENLLDFIEQAITICMEDEFIFKGISHGLRYPEQGVLKYREDRPFYVLINQLVKACQEEGSISPKLDPMDLTTHITISIRGTIIEWRLNEGRFDVISFARKHAEMVLFGAAN